MKKKMKKMKMKKRKEKERRKKKSKDTEPVSASEAVEESLPSSSPSRSRSRSPSPLPSPLSLRSLPSVPSPPLSTSPSPCSRPPQHRSRSRFQPSSPSSAQRRQRSCSPRSPSLSSLDGGRRSRFRSWSPIASSSFGFPIAPQPSSPDEAEAAAVEEEAKALYLFFSYIFGPIDYCLHALKFPNLILPPHPLQPCDKFRETENTIYPILEFPSGEYPTSMCCVELGWNPSCTFWGVNFSLLARGCH